jgi:CRISPR-associated protein Cmr1
MKNLISSLDVIACRACYYSNTEQAEEERCAWMQGINFNVQTVTPLFMAGADQTTAELRVPSFRGEMRYWFRALVAGLVGTDAEGLKRVKELEAKVFGTTDHGSAVSIHLSNFKGSIREFTESISERGTDGRWQATGKGYLLWSMAQSGRPGRNFKPARRYFPPSTTFNLELAARGIGGEELQQAITAFWLLTNLGGVGSRSRRCAGSLFAQVIPPSQKNAETISNVTTDLSFTPVANVAALKQHLERGIATARTLVKPDQNNRRPVHEANFDALSKETCRIWILQDRGKPWNSADDAMKAIGADLQWYRSGIKPLEDRAIFGLPLKDVTNARRASPLLLRITQLQGNKYVGVAVLFKTFYRDIYMEDYDEIIAEWLNTFDSSIEVTL